MTDIGSRLDPPVRKDGTCAQCAGPRPQVTRAMRKYSGHQIENDPFCSSICARNYYGVPLSTGPTCSADPYVKPMSECGTTAGYSSGCRCERCRGAEARRQRDRRAGDPAYREKERERHRRRKQAKREAA